MLAVAPPTIQITFSAFDDAVARLDAWLDTVRGSDGYGGPVAHWWQQSLLHTGAGRDWRYEGIIAGYLDLWRNTGDPRWLGKARRAGDDLLGGQLPSGHFAASGFEINPATAGTPHEAACDAGLLLLALALRANGDPAAHRYAACAERNLRSFYLDQLWDAAAGSFRDDPRTPSFVPNKAATACDALFLLAEWSGDDQWVDRYVLPTLDQIVAHQVRGGRLDGAIAQNSFGSHVIHKYFPIYIARCVPALLSGYRWSSDARYADSALRAMQFIARSMYADGTLPTVVYHNHRTNRYPCWIAPLGDVLRAADLIRSYGSDADWGAMQRWLLAWQDPSGGIQTARGFAAQAGGCLTPTPDVRDVLHVAGWCDKAFRYLATHSGDLLPDVASEPFEIDCTFRGRAVRLIETTAQLDVRDRSDVRYRWIKGQPQPEIAAPEFWLR